MWFLCYWVGFNCRVVVLTGYVVTEGREPSFLVCCVLCVSVCGCNVHVWMLGGPSFDSAVSRHHYQNGKWTPAASLMISLWFGDPSPSWTSSWLGKHWRRLMNLGFLASGVSCLGLCLDTAECLRSLQAFRISLYVAVPQKPCDHVSILHTASYQCFHSYAQTTPKLIEELISRTFLYSLEKKIFLGLHNCNVSKL